MEENGTSDARHASKVGGWASRIRVPHPVNIGPRTPELQGEVKGWGSKIRVSIFSPLHINDESSINAIKYTGLLIL